MARGLMPGKKPEKEKPKSAVEMPGKKNPGAAFVEQSAQQQPAPGKEPTAQEQADYEAFLDMAMDVLYPKQGDAERPEPGIVKRLMFRSPESGQDESGQAVAALASATVAIAIRVQEEFKQRNRKISPAAMYHAGAELMGAIAEMAAAPNPANGGKPIYDYSEEEMKGAWLRAVDQYQQMQVASGDLPREAMQHDWGEIVGAAKAGNLESISPELAQAARGGAENG